MQTTAILFVCAGNICRSPLAEGVFIDLAAKAHRQAQFITDSAGTGAWHQGERPDPRSMDIARENGFDISGQRARRVQGSDFQTFDLILAMDQDNLRDLKRIAPATAHHRLHLFSQYALGRAQDIPDPYYGGPDGFRNVYSMLLEGCSCILEKL